MERKTAKNNNLAVVKARKLLIRANKHKLP